MLNKYTWIFYMALLFNWQRILSSHERRRKRRNVRTFFRDKAKGSRVLYSICLKKKKKKQTTLNRRYGAEHCSNMDYNNEAEFLSMHITNHSFIK